MKTISRALACLALLSAVSCGPTVEATRTADAPAARAPKAGVIDVFNDATAVPRKYRVLASLSLDDKAYGYSETQMRGLLIKEAQSIGADGVILSKMEETSGGGPRISWTLIVPKKPTHTIKGTAFVYE